MDGEPVGFNVTYFWIQLWHSPRLQSPQECLGLGNSLFSYHPPLYCGFLGKTQRREFLGQVICSLPDSNLSQESIVFSKIWPISFFPPKSLHLWQDCSYPGQASPPGHESCVTSPFTPFTYKSFSPLRNLVHHGLLVSISFMPSVAMSCTVNWREIHWIDQMSPPLPGMPPSSSNSLFQKHLPCFPRLTEGPQPLAPSLCCTQAGQCRMRNSQACSDHCQD